MIRSVYIPRRPASVAKQYHNLRGVGREPQFAVGPSCPKAGPTFPTMLAAAVSDVKTSRPAIAPADAVASTRMKHIRANDATTGMNDSCPGLPFMRRVKTRCG